jgi:N-acetylmuramoyl-L-alanine amidase
VSARRRSALAGKADRALVRMLGAVAAAGLLTSACAGSSAGSSSPGAATSPVPVPSTATSTPTTPSATGSPSPTGSGSTGSQSSGKPLAGKVVGVDPGHNGLNYAYPAIIDRQIWNGRELENCNTTGTETDGGYTEAQFNFNVATYLAADLRADGARVVLTRTNNHGVGPCVNRRAQIIDQSHANVAIDIHADGGPAWGRGFTVLEPVADGPNDKIISAALRFGSYVRTAFLTDTPMQESDYYGHNGTIFRDNLAGLNLTTVPEVLIECGNMRNATDARLLTSPAVQRQIAGALQAAIIRFLTGR